MLHKDSIKRTVNKNQRRLKTSDMDKKKLNFFERDKKNNKRTQYTFPPCAVLKPIIKGYMIMGCEQGIDVEILPRTSVSINYILNGNISLKQDDGGTINLPKATAFGIARKTQCFTFSDHTTLLVAIVKDGAASTLIKKPIHKLFEQFVDLNELFSDEQICFLDSQLKEQKSDEGIVQTLESFFLSVVDFIPIDAMIEEALLQIRKKNGVISINTLADELHVSKDVFEKKFRRLVGTTPKHYANIVRFRNLIHKPHLDENLTDMGLDAGYYDQSHFIREFKSFTGKPPSKFF